MQLPKEIQKTIDILKTHSNIPIEVALPSILSIISLAVGGRYKVDPLDYPPFPLNLYTLSLMPTGATKSAILAKLLAPVKDHIAIKAKEMQQLADQYAIDLKIYNKQESTYINGVASGTLDPAFDPKPIKPIKPMSSRLILDSFTLNGLIDSLKSQPAIALITDEASGFFNSYSFKDGGSQITSALTNLYSGSQVSRVTGIAEDVTFINNKTVTILLMAQPTALSKIVRRSDFGEQGFMHRFLISACPSFDVPKMSVIAGESEKKAVQFSIGMSCWNSRITSLLEDKFDLDDAFEPIWKLLPLESDARIIINNNFNENQTVNYINDALFDAFARRRHEMSLRIAGLFALFDLRTIINVEDVMSAIDVFSFFEQQRAMLSNNLELGDTSLTLEQEAESKLVKWMQGRGDVGIGDIARGPKILRDMKSNHRTAFLEDLCNRGVLVLNQRKYSVV
jgi:hypothetical protein